MAGCVGAGRDRGFALLLVLWPLVLLTLLATRLVAAGRGEAQLAANLRAAAGTAPGPGGRRHRRGLGRGPVWPGQPERRLGRVDEVGLVLGMTPALLDRLRPHLTVWWDGDPDPAAADPEVQAALRVIGVQSGSGGEAGAGSVLVTAITAEALGPHGSRFMRRAVVQMMPGPVGGAQWHVPEWRVSPC